MAEKKEDWSDILPDGKRFEYWEKELVFTKELHVDQKNPTADDGNDGSKEHPFRTIGAAARLAEPGTRVMIHAGVYRECVRPERGGADASHMISYENYDSDQVVIKASEVVDEFYPSTDWNLVSFGPAPKVQKDLQIWEIRLKPEQFMGYNPFCTVNILHDRLFIEYEKTDMTTYLNRRGMVFCDGKPLKQVSLYNQMSTTQNSYWVEANGQKVHFCLEGNEDPKNHVIEVTCREQCFAPEIPFLPYIRVKGLILAHAATGAPVPQRGALSCYRGHHWIIEDCEIDWSNAVGIDIGNECWHHKHTPGQILGYTVIRNCNIHDVGVCGIAGLFVSNILIEDNLIQGVGFQKMELSWEAGGIKVHNCHNSLIRRNIFRDTIRADHLWMDVDNQNNRITQNLFLHGIEQREAIFIECTREGICLIDHNIFWDVEGRFDEKKIPKEPGSTGWYKMVENDVVNGYAVYGEGTDRLHVIHNLIGKCRSAGYFLKPVSFRIGPGGRGGTSRDAVIKNNIFYDCGEAAIKFPTEKNSAEGNLYLNMPGGYLRILYPEPEVCLDLPAWQEFYGFDLQGQEGRLNISLDPEDYTLTIGKGAELPQWGHGTNTKKIVTTADDIKPVKAEEKTRVDYFGEELPDEHCLPGPFGELKENAKIKIDPRRMKQ